MNKNYIEEYEKQKMENLEKYKQEKQSDKSFRENYFGTHVGSL